MSNANIVRAKTLADLATTSFDVLVIGGGVTGLGVAVDAVTRGLNVALVERQDFSSGTSSKSSKLIHGGMRYLQQREIKLVFEALHERHRLMTNAPHLVEVLPFMIPILTRNGVISKKIARALGTALWLYDITGGWRIGKLHRRLNTDQAINHAPTMSREKMSSAYLYFDATADDSRICVGLARTAQQHGAVVANYIRVDKVLHDHQQRAIGVLVTPTDGNPFEIRAKVIINATGVWSDQIRTVDQGENPDSIRPAKGIHLTVPWDKVRNDIAVVIPVPGDKRSLFMVPWISNFDGTYQYTYVGTTDTDYQGSIDNPLCTSDDIDYVLKALNSAISTNVTRQDVTGSWSGLRPLVKSHSQAKLSSRTSDLSRRHQVSISESGVITITGGKLTTYRKMAQDTVDTALVALGRKAKCRTKKLKLIGSVSTSSSYAQPSKLPSSWLDQHLFSRYGYESDIIKQIIADNGDLAQQLVPGLPYLGAEAIFAVTHESARTLDDVLSRRTRSRLLDRKASANNALRVANLIGPLLGWSDDEIDNQVTAYRESCSQEDQASINK